MSESVNANIPGIDYSKRFLKQFKKAPVRVRLSFLKRVAIFLKDPYHPQLHNHLLAGSLQRYKSINITGDWRALFRMIEREGHAVIFFDAIGTHSQLYGK